VGVQSSGWALRLTYVRGGATGDLHSRKPKTWIDQLIDLKNQMRNYLIIMRIGYAVNKLPVHAGGSNYIPRAVSTLVSYMQKIYST
jgi:hypothetical protein